MVRQKQGKIVNISSVWGLAGASCETAYSATKGGVIAMTKTWAKELARRGAIRANCVAPGFIESPMTEVLSEKVVAGMMERTPLARFGTADDVANAILFLASDEASYITGQVLPVTGGLVI